MPSPSHKTDTTKPGLSLGMIVALLGITQIVGYGTVTYSFAIIAPGIAREFGVDPNLPFTVLSLGLLLSGFSAPLLGRIVDQQGAARVMVLGNIAVVALLAVSAAAPNFWILAGLILVTQNVGLSVLYGAAFPSLAQHGGTNARRAITQLTLIGGLASTVFWPISGWLMGIVDWRGTYLFFALCNLVICLPIHVFIARREPKGTAPRLVAPSDPEPQKLNRRFALWMVALCFGTTAIVATALTVHMVPILGLSGLGEQAYLVSMIVGPAMVLVRLGEVLVWKSVSPVITTALSLLCFPLAIVMLLVGLPPLLAGILFALFYGFGHGLNVIAFGTLPLYLFGRDGYGAVLGDLNASRALMSAVAPAAFSFALTMVGFHFALGAGLIVGLLALVPLLVLMAAMRR